MLSPELFQKVLSWIIAGGVGLIAIVWVGRMTWREVGKPLYRFGKGVSSLSELVPNGGTSIKDQITGLCGRVESIDNKVTQIESKLALTTAITLADFETDPMPKLRFSTDLHLESASQAALSALHLSFEEARGHGWKNAMPAFLRAKVTEEIEAAAKEQRRCTLEIVVLEDPAVATKTDGRHYLMQLLPLPDGLNKFIGFIGYIAPLSP